MSERKAPLMNVFTLGVHDVAAQRDFYRRLGWPEIMFDDAFAAFELGGAVLALFPVDKLAADGHAQPDPGRGGIRFCIGIIVDSAAEVDQLADQFRKAGGQVTKEPEDAEFFEGRSCYVTDPEGNYFEITWALPDNVVLIAAHRAAGRQPLA